MRLGLFRLTVENRSQGRSPIRRGYGQGVTDEDQTSSQGDPDTAGRNRLRRPSLMVFDVDETLSDMSPMASAPQWERPHPAELCFAGLLRDGFSRTAVGVNESFAATRSTT